MKKILNNKFIVVSLLTVTIVFGIILLHAFDFKSNKIGNYQKYSMLIFVETKINGKISPIRINLYNDGSNTQIISNTNDVVSAYLIDNSIMYRKSETIYRYPVQTSYIDIYNLISKYDYDIEKEDKKAKICTALVKTKDINKILSALFFSKKSQEDGVVRVTITDNKITDFNLILSNIEGYDKIDIDIKFEELDRDYKVSTAAVLGPQNTNKAFKLKNEVLNENPFEIIK